MHRGLVKFLKLPRREKLLFSESLLLHLWVGLLLKTVSFKRITRVFENSQPAAGKMSRDAVAGNSQPPELILMIKDAIRRAGRISPWRNRCLVSSLVARKMLNRLGIESEITLGVSKGGSGKINAHAWLKAKGFEIVEKGGNYTSLYNF